MLFGNPHIETAVGEAFGKKVQPRPTGIAAVTATILSSCRASVIRLSAKTLV